MMQSKEPESEDEARDLRAFVKSYQGEIILLNVQCFGEEQKEDKNWGRSDYKKAKPSWKTWDHKRLDVYKHVIYRSVAVLGA